MKCEKCGREGSGLFFGVFSKYRFYIVLHVNNDLLYLLLLSGHIQFQGLEEESEGLHPHAVFLMCTVGWVLALPGGVDDPQSCVSVPLGESPQVQGLLHNGAVLQQWQAHSAVNSLT